LQPDPSRKLGPTSKGKLRAAQPIDDGSTVRRLVAAREASAERASDLRAIRKNPTAEVARALDGARVTPAERKAARKAAQWLARRARRLASAPLAGAPVAGPVRSTGETRDASGCVREPSDEPRAWYYSSVTAL
jgi:hypothetical protein